MRGDEMFKEMNYAKTNDQIPVVCGRPGRSACPRRGTPETSALRFVLGVRQQRDFQ